MRYVTVLFGDFFKSEKAGGILLASAAILSLLLVNLEIWPTLPDQLKSYLDLGVPGLKLSIEHWVNDLFMAIFFLLIGLELEREIYAGELSVLKKASLPIAAALGGMLLPALIHFLFNTGTPTQSGWGIPMATDIAFALAMLTVLGKKVPTTVKVFLTALAVIDDLGAILVIAIFYSSGIKWMMLGISLGIWGVLLLLNKLKVNKLFPYLLGGIAMWYFMLQSGVHATISGVLLAFAIPFGNGGAASPSFYLQHKLHYPVAYFILPVFAFVNTAIVLTPDVFFTADFSNMLGIGLGLVLGKPIGVFLFSVIAIKLGISQLPSGMNYLQVAATGMLAGIGFTMAIFISLLAFDDPFYVLQSKMAIIIGSVISAVFGLLTFQWSFRK